MKRLALALLPLLFAVLACGSPPTTPPDLRLTITAAAGQFGIGATLFPAAPAGTLAAPAVAGQTRDNPLSGAEGVDIGGNMLLTVLKVTRPANSQVTAGNMFNATPAADLEYATVQIQVECAKSANEKCTFTTLELKAVGSDGQVHDVAFVAGVPNSMNEITYQFFGGSKITGVLVFLFPRNDSQVVLFHEALIFGTPVYISLP